MKKVILSLIVTIILAASTQAEARSGFTPKHEGSLSKGKVERVIDAPSR